MNTTARSPRVLVVAEGFPPSTSTGGPARSVAAIVAAEQRGCSISVLTRDRDLGRETPYSRREREAVAMAFPLAKVKFVRPSPMRALLAFLKEVRHAEVVYFNSLFSPWFTLLPLAALRVLGGSRVALIAPRGELNPGALAIKSRKKRAALPLIRWLIHGRRIVWHASSARDAQVLKTSAISRAFPVLRRDIVVPPRDPSSNLPNIFTLCFVGRIVPIKNLTVALKALEGFPTPIRLIVLGSPEDRAYVSECERVLEHLPAHVIVEFSGEKPHDEVVEQLKRCHAMVLPTAGENFGHAIAEALSVGCPVLIPDTTPWTSLVKEGAGWLIAASDSRPLHETLVKLSERSEPEWRATRQEVFDLFTHWSSTRERQPLFADAVNLAVPFR